MRRAEVRVEGRMREPAFEKVGADRRYEVVVRQFLALIERGEIEPGAKLPPERELAGWLGVSRNVLREAFRVLEVRGIVRSHAGGGRYVRDDNLAPALAAEGVVLRLEQAVIGDILEARELLEVQVVRLAAERGDAAPLREVLARTGDGWEENVRFHTALAAATGNFMLERLVRLQLDLLRDVHQRDHYPTPRTARTLLDEHRAIADAVAARDPEAGERAVRHHLRHTREAVRE